MLTFPALLDPRQCIWLPAIFRSKSRIHRAFLRSHDHPHHLGHQMEDMVVHVVHDFGL